MTRVLFRNSIVSIIPKFNIMCRYIEPRNPALMIIKVSGWYACMILHCGPVKQLSVILPMGLR